MIRLILKTVLPVAACWFALSAGNHLAVAQNVAVQSQSELQSRIAQRQPATYRFVKKKPVVGWVLKSDRFEDIPQAIRGQLGEVDKTKYTQAFLAENKGSIIALQMDDGKPDFYIIGKPTFETKYEKVEVASALQHNPALTAWLETMPDLSKLIGADKGAIVGARKSKKVEMIKLSALGYEIGKQVTIQSPWGEQSKPAGQDAYLTKDSSSGQYYLINLGENGHPLSYDPAQ